LEFARSQLPGLRGIPLTKDRRQCVVEAAWMDNPSWSNFREKGAKRFVATTAPILRYVANAAVRRYLMDVACAALEADPSAARTGGILHENSQPYRGAGCLTFAKLAERSYSVKPMFSICRLKVGVMFDPATFLFIR
jgi:hypothetical protein